MYALQSHGPMLYDNGQECTAMGQCYMIMAKSVHPWANVICGQECTAMGQCYMIMAKSVQPWANVI